MARLLAARGSARHGRAVSEGCSVSTGNISDRVISAHLLSTGAASGSHGVRATEFSAQLGLLLSLLVPLAFSLKWCLGESRLRRASRHVLASAASSVMPTCVLIWRLGASRLFCACLRLSHCVWPSACPAVPFGSQCSPLDFTLSNRSLHVRALLHAFRIRSMLIINFLSHMTNRD